MPASKRIELLDYGRFSAALCVVAFHYLFNGIHNGKISSITHIPSVIGLVQYGYLGVSFFFMISGYVIFFSAKQKTADQFLASRAIRLYPSYWAAVFITTVAAQYWGGSKMAVSFPQALANLTMFPAWFGHNYVDGVYWTLRYEWIFYITVFVFLLIGFQKKLGQLFVLWPVYILVARWTNLQWLPSAESYYSFFAAGALFATLKQHRGWAPVVSLLLCLYLCISFAAGQAPDLTASKGIYYSPVVIGMIVALQFAFFAFLNTSTGSSLELPGSRLAGDLTYPVYLIHAHFGYMFLSAFATEENKIVMYGITLTLVLAISSLMYVVVEHRLAWLWRLLFSRPLSAMAGRLRRK